MFNDHGLVAENDSVVILNGGELLICHSDLSLGKKVYLPFFHFGEELISAILVKSALNLGTILIDDVNFE